MTLYPRTARPDTFQTFGNVGYFDGTLNAPVKANSANYSSFNFFLSAANSSSLKLGCKYSILTGPSFRIKLSGK